MSKEVEVIKKGYTRDRFNLSQIEELKKCMEDPLYFCKNYVKIQHPTKGRVPFKMYPYQEELISAFHQHRYSIALTARQMGKCLNINTPIKLKSPKGEIVEMKIGDFYEWQRFKDWGQKKLQELQRGVLGQDKE